MPENIQSIPGEREEIVARPRDQLNDYPVEVRWEVTRRHPYYQMFWSEALLYRQNLLGDNPVQMLLRQGAMLILGAIGVGGKPVSPATPFEALLDGNTDPAFLTGSVQPMTFRAMVATLINGLPPAERAVVGALLMSGGGDEYSVPGDNEDRTVQKKDALFQLARVPSPALDSYPVVPLFYVHLGASQRSIVRDMEDQVRRWKQRRGLGGAKVHTSNLKGYLEVWDLREGWTGGDYDQSLELTFAEVGRRLKIEAISTVANRYRSAFEMITGQEFSPELWCWLFGPLKFGTLFGDPDRIRIALARRHLGTRTRRPVPDSVVSAPSDQAHRIGTVESGSAIGDDIEFQDLLMDLRDLISRGATDEQIAEELEFDDSRVIAQIRSRLDDFRSI